MNDKQEIRNCQIEHVLEIMTCESNDGKSYGAYEIDLAIGKRIGRGVIAVGSYMVRHRMRLNHTQDKKLVKMMKALKIYPWPTDKKTRKKMIKRLKKKHYKKTSQKQQITDDEVQKPKSPSSP